jgi:hypothetical protein
VLANGRGVGKTPAQIGTLEIEFETLYHTRHQISSNLLDEIGEHCGCTQGKRRGGGVFVGVHDHRQGFLKSARINGSV